ncbi:MAG: phosphoribosyltransferase family protein [bacterium]
MLEATARSLRESAEALLAVVVPPLCVLCQQRLAPWERWLCGRCDLAVSMRGRPRSRALALGDGSALEVRYALDYTGRVSGLVWEMKYGGKPGIAGYLARFLWLGAEDVLGRDAVLVPVPLHGSRRRERGYNQSENLARAVARPMRLAVAAGALARKRNTRSQATLARSDRVTNVLGSFQVRRQQDLEGRPVVLVDDVVTTGSTLAECARVLRNDGVEDLRACVVASAA